MPTDLTQTLGFDASSALASLTQLDGALAKLEAGLRSTASTMAAFNTAGSRTSTMLGKLAGNATKATASLNTVSAAKGTAALSALGAASTSASNKVAASSQSIAASNAATAASIGRLSTSAQLLSRVVFTQAIVRALSTIRRSFQQTAEEAVGFQRSIALIQTIDNSGQSFEQVANSVRDLSSAFNLPLLETAKGVYQTISNQIGDVSQSLNFLTEAAKFAKATNSSLADSVDLLSAAIKSYGLSVNDTSKVASIFFKTIDLGRVNADELANSMGRVLPIASQLGVSLEESGAALAAISIKGSGTSESITQLRAIMTALLKPTDAMKTALSGLGFTSAEIAIQTLGLAGTLRALNTQAGGSIDKLAAMFQNVRGLAGAANLTGDGVRGLANTIDEMDNAARKLNNNKFLQVMQTDAEQVTSEFNKLHNALVTGLGQDLLRGTNSIIQFTGGAERLTDIMRGSVPAIGAAAGALLALNANLIASRNNATGLAGAFGLVSKALSAVAIGEVIGTLFDNARSQANLAPLKALEKTNADALDKYKEQLFEARDADTKAASDRKQTALKLTADLNKTYLQQQADLLAANKVIKQLQGKTKLTQPQNFQLSQARSTVANARSPLAGVPNVDQIAALSGTSINNIDDLNKAIVSLNNRSVELRRNMANAFAVNSQVQNLESEITSIFKLIDQKANVRNSVSGQFADDLRAEFDTLDTLFKKANADGKVTDEEMQRLIERGKQFNQDAFNGSQSTLGHAGFDTSIELLGQVLQKFQQVRQLESQPQGNFGEMAAELAKIDGAMVSFTTRLQAGVDASAAIANNLERAAVAAQKGATSGQVQAHAKGGIVRHFADGGFAPRGTDTIPAMLSPGEFVVNADATKQFYSQLVSINSGRQPIYRAAGGPTNNVTFTGDINIAENNSGRDTARGLMDQIRRQLRRGTGQL